MKIKNIASLYLLCVLGYLVLFLPMYSTLASPGSSATLIPVMEQGRVRFFNMVDLYYRENPPVKFDETKESVKNLLTRFHESRKRFYYYRFDTMFVEISAITMGFSSVGLIFGNK